MATRRYRQHCALAKSLDLLGDRWTLLVVRELLDGPKRYVDLLDGLVSIPTDTLAVRLRHPEGHGIVTRRTLLPPADRTVYELTDAGRGIEEIIDAYVRWGFPLIEQRDTDDVLRPEWFARAVRSLLRPDRSGVDVRFALRTPEVVVALHVTDDAVTDLDADAPIDVTIDGPVEQLTAALDPARAAQLVTEGSITVRGSREDIGTVASLFAEQATSAGDRPGG